MQHPCSHIGNNYVIYDRDDDYNADDRSGNGGEGKGDARLLQ